MMMFWWFGVIIAGAAIDSAKTSGPVLVPALVALGCAPAGWGCRRIGQWRATRRGDVTVFVAADRLSFEDRSGSTTLERDRIGLVVLYIKGATGTGTLNPLGRIVVFDPARKELADVRTGWTGSLGFRMRYRLRQLGYPTAIAHPRGLSGVFVRVSRRAPDWTREVAP